MTLSMLYQCCFNVLNFTSFTAWQIYCLHHVFHTVRAESGPVFLSSNRVFSRSDGYTSEALMGWEGLDKHPNDFLNHLNLSSLQNRTGKFSEYNLICKVCIISASSYKFYSHFLTHKISSRSHWNSKGISKE